MRAILLANNKDLLREIQCVKESVCERTYHPALSGYVEWILQFLKEKEETVNDNLYYLSLNVNEILSEIMERTQLLTLNIRILSAKYISPLIRSNKSDNLSLALIKWLHNQHPQSKHLSFAISDGSFSIYPSKDIPLIYYLPTSSKKCLLHLALFFHEFGHYLFIYHGPEMVNYIAQMQDDMEELLVNPYQQNDSRFHTEIKKKKKIIEAWYDWIEEIFCDLVGLSIGGAAYLHTFSIYLRMSGREGFYLSDKELEVSTHPVSRIRIKFLVERARKMGLGTDADIVEKEWKKMEELMGITPIYHGYYTPAYDHLINRTLDDMLEEASPISFKDYLSDSSIISNDEINFIQLLHSAWAIQLNNSDRYEDWERDSFTLFHRSESSNRSGLTIANQIVPDGGNDSFFIKRAN